MASNFSSSRKNSLTSLSTLNTMGNSNMVSSPSARGLSTDNLITLDNKFVKKSMKKPPTAFPPTPQPSAPNKPPSPDNFHKTNGGTYYFPNGEVFRPRLTPSKRNRPSKVVSNQAGAGAASQQTSRASSLTSQSSAAVGQIQAQQLQHLQLMGSTFEPSSSASASPPSSLSFSNSNSNSQDSFAGRNNSLHSLHNSSSTTLSMHAPNVPIQKSHSYNNIKQLSKQNLSKNIRLNRMDTPTNITLGSSSESTYSRSNSMLAGATQQAFTANSRSNSLVSLQNLSSTNLRNQGYNYNHNHSNHNNGNVSTAGFSPYSPSQPAKLHSTNILKASNPSLNSIVDSTAEASPTNNTPYSKNRDPVLSQTESGSSNFSTRSSTSSSSSAYSSSSAASVSTPAADPSILVSHPHLNRSMSNTPTTSINTDDTKNAGQNNTNSASSNISTPEKANERKSLESQSQSQSQASAPNAVGEKLEEFNRDLLVSPVVSESDEDDEGNLSTLNEVSEENLSKSTTTTENKLQSTQLQYSNESKKARKLSDERPIKPSLSSINRAGSDDDLLYSTPRNSPLVEETVKFQNIEQIIESKEASNEEDLSRPELTAFKKHERSTSVLPEPTIEDSSFDTPEQEETYHTVNEKSASPTPRVTMDGSFNDQLSNPSTPKNSKFFDFSSDTKFNRFLNDDQVAVPPRGDLVVLKNQKIRKHDRASSSISSFNSIINNEGESPRTPNRVSASSSPPPPPPHIVNSSMKSPVHAKSPLKIDPVVVRSGSPTSYQFILKQAEQESASPIPTSTPTAFTSSFDNTNDDLKPPSTFKDHDQISSSADSSLHLYSIHEGSKSSIISAPKEKRSMLDLEGAGKVIGGPAKPAPKVKLEKPIPKVPRVGSHPIGSSASEPKLESPQRTLKSRAKSMTNLASNPKPTPKSNFKSFMKKMFTVKPPKGSSSGYNSSINSTDLESRSVHNSHLDSKSVKSVAGSVAPSSDMKSNHSNHSNSRTYTRSFSFQNLKSSKIGSKLTNKRTIKTEESLPPTLPPKPVAITRPDSIFIEQVLTKLPSIEREDSMFDDMLLTFDEKLTEKEEEVQKSPVLIGLRSSSGTIKDPFLKDDELTSAQIKDQQMKDKQGEPDEDLGGPGSLAEIQDYIKHGRPLSEELYVDDNIRFLQSEFNWSNLDENELSAKMTESINRSSIIADVKNPLGPSPTQNGPIFVTSDQLNYIFNNLTDFQKRSLPGHLKYIKQFKDFSVLEIDIKKFEDLEGVERAPDSTTPSVPILKRIDGNILPQHLTSEGSDSPKKRVVFSNKISINETFAPDMYKRYNKSVTQYTLTESFEINNIKNELNNYKCNEMLVHENSQNNTHFFY